jgi:TonB family protein
MNIRALAFISFAVCVLLPQAVDAIDRVAYLNTIGTRAVDAKGVRHDGNTYPRKHPPWLDDILKTLAPQYPYIDRAQRHVGQGWFAIYLDLPTGVPTKVIALKSTGFSSLDNCAIASFREWRWKPGKWKEIDMPVTFTLNAVPKQPAGSVRLPSR